MSKNPFIEYVKVWRKENPEVGYKDALKSASIDYKKMDKPQKVQTVKAPKTKEQKETKNNRAKLIRDFKKLETSINSGNIANYDDFVKIGNALRGKSTTNSYAKKLRLIERKIKSKKYKTLQSKLSKEEQNLQMKIAQKKKTKDELDLENLGLNKDKMTAKLRKEERIAKRKRALKLVKNPNGTRKYTDAQIDQMLKLEEEGLTSKDIKATTTALGKYLKDDYLKEFKRINPTFNDYRARDYLIRNKSYENDPYNVPVVNDATELANANKPKPLPTAPPLPPPPIAPTTPAVKPLKLTKKNQDLRKKLLEDFGLDNTQFDISNLDVDLTKDLYFGQNDGFESKRDGLTSKTQITKKRREIKRLLSAYGTNRGTTYDRLQDIDELLEDYEGQLLLTKKQIKKDEKQEKLQIEDLIDNILKDATDKAEDISKKVEAKKDETLDIIQKRKDTKKAKEDAEKAKKEAEDKEKEIKRLKDKEEQDKKDLKAKLDAIKADATKKASEKRIAEKKAKDDAKALKKQQEDEIKKLGKEKKEQEKLQRQEEAKQRKINSAIEKAKKDAEKANQKPKIVVVKTLTPPTPKPQSAGGKKPPSSPPPQSAGGKSSLRDIPNLENALDNINFNTTNERQQVIAWKNLDIDELKPTGIKIGMLTTNTKMMLQYLKQSLRETKSDKNSIEGVNEVRRLIQNLIGELNKAQPKQELTEITADGKMVWKDKPQPQSAGGKKPPSSPQPQPQPKRDKAEIEKEIKEAEDKTIKIRAKLGFGRLTNKVNEDLERALQTNSLDDVPSNIRPIFDDILSRGVSMEQETAQARDAGDFAKFSQLYKDDNTAQNNVDLIVRTYFLNNNKSELEELEDEEDKIVSLESEIGGAGFGGGSLATHLQKAQEYFTSGKMSEHANLVRRHIKMAKKIVDNLPSSENVDKIKSIVDMADDILN
jgi:hypothetical protein